MVERDSVEVEKTLLFISDARARADASVRQLRKQGADGRVIESIEQASRELAETHRRLMQATYFAAPDLQLL